MLKSTTRSKFARSLLGTAALTSLLTGCAAIDRIKQLGEPVALAPIDNPTAKPGYKPVQMPMPTPQPITYNPNSLWRNGSRAFFNDQRAHIVGDILTVKVNINDTAQFQDQTQLSRTSTEDTEVTNFIGANAITNPAKAVLPGSILTASGNSQMNGQGNINRNDQLVTNVAAVVTQLLPNGNMVIEGKQEIRLNNEIRELIVAGVVRPEDIQSDNTIELPKIAEARLAYGGRGTLTNIQTERWGQQAVDIILPF
ncbi:MAG: flagellar basal body L-ring protein FlgH [Xanthobacteraceae bacterium]|jgi:flagellar L-ring protein precursor FlgH